MGYKTIDIAQLATHFDSASSERKLAQRWDELKTYSYDSNRGRGETFVVDTPPPTVSGSLHIGHVFSYTHTDLIVRYKRMRGFNTFYPMGWDDNGLPTERRVQNYFHVRCAPDISFQPDLKIEMATDAQRKGPPRMVSRSNFINLCLELTREDEKVFKNLWRRVGLSVDWEQEYSTIDDFSRSMAQLSFIDLYEKGHVYSLDAPTMWDVDFHTAVAQAETEDRTIPDHFHHIAFGVDGSDESIVIATTRPELLPACVAVTAHPDDERYKHLFGKYAITPLFRVPVPIFPSDLVNPEKGTGILMVCTFGDATDVYWWREQKLALRQIVGRDGRLLPVKFGEPGWESLNPTAANDFYEKLTGKSIKTSQKAIVELLRETSGAATGAQAPLRGEPIAIEHAVKFFEKGDRPLEFIPTRQWFVRLLDKKDMLIAFGDRIAWHPDFMRLRYRNWTENLQFDWCISRQRYFGVPFPVWYPLNENGRPDYSRPIIAKSKDLPIDPMLATPNGYVESQRNQPGGFAGESDVFDTWFTSSLSPQICSRWNVDPVRHERLFPMDWRPQSHEIIRTWAFYTIAKSLLHHDRIPWNNVGISGWVLDPDRKKMSKSKGNVLTPIHLLDEYGADAVRYWSANARLGTDTAFDDKVLKVGKRLVTKIYNASKFVLAIEAEPYSIICDLDLAFIGRLKNLVATVTSSFERFDHASALDAIERFFWNDFTDTFIELVKGRCRDESNAADKASAVGALRLGLNVLLRLFAPFLPYITEEVWSWALSEETQTESIHKSPWPSEADFAAIPVYSRPEIFDTAVACLTLINKRKSEASVSIGRPIDRLAITANRRTVDLLNRAMSDVLKATRAKEHYIKIDASLEDGAILIDEVTFSEA
jgi:valyl-tRNA synthetase